MLVHAMLQSLKTPVAVDRTVVTTRPPSFVLHGALRERLRDPLRGTARFYPAPFLEGDRAIAHEAHHATRTTAASSSRQFCRQRLASSATAASHGPASCSRSLAPVFRRASSSHDA